MRFGDVMLKSSWLCFYGHAVYSVHWLLLHDWCLLLAWRCCIAFCNEFPAFADWLWFVLPSGVIKNNDRQPTNDVIKIRCFSGEERRQEHKHSSPVGGRAQTLSPAPLHTSLRIDDEWLSDHAGRSTRWQHRAVGRGQKFVVPGNTFHFSFPALFIDFLYFKN